MSEKRLHLAVNVNFSAICTAKASVSPVLLSLAWFTVTSCGSLSHSLCTPLLGPLRKRQP